MGYRTTWLPLTSPKAALQSPTCNPEFYNTSYKQSVSLSLRTWKVPWGEGPGGPWLKSVQEYPGVPHH